MKSICWPARWTIRNASVRRLTSSPESSSPGSGARSFELEFEHLHRVAEVDAPRIVLLQLEAVQRLDRLADEKRAALRVERAVGAEQDSFGSIKIYSTPDRGPRPVHRGVAVEHPEVVHRALRHLLQQRCVVLVRSAGAELVHAVADAVDEEWRHRAQMVSDDAQLRQPVELGGLLGTSQELDGRHRQGQDLLVLGEALHHAHALVEVPQHRNVHPALELRRERRVALGDSLHPLEVRLRKDVGKNVELKHYSSFTPAMVESSLQRAASARMLRPKASPSSGSVSSWPMSMRRFENSGLREMAGSSRDSRSITSFGAAARVKTPNN